MCNFSTCLSALLLLLVLVACGETEKQTSPKVKAFLDDYEQTVVEFESLAKAKPFDEAGQQRLSASAKAMQEKVEPLKGSETWTKADQDRFKDLTIRLAKLRPPKKK